MTTHGTGNFKGTRQGNHEIRQHFLFRSVGVTGAGNDIVTGTNQKLCTLPGTSALPLLYTVRLIEIAANTAAGAVTASIGTASAGTQLLNAVSLKSTAGTTFAPANAETYSEVDVDIWLNYTVASGTDAAGQFLVEVSSREVNVTAPNNSLA